MNRRRRRSVLGAAAALLAAALSASLAGQVFRDGFEHGDARAWDLTLPDQRQVTVLMSAATVDALAAGGYSLYGFKAVASGDRAGRPLVWLRRESFATSTVFGWTPEYQAYTSFSPIQPHQVIHEGFTIDLVLGQTFVVDSATGTGGTTAGGPADAISIHNITTTRFTAGIAQKLDGGYRPPCAFPLYGGFVDVVRPLEKVLLIFSTNDFEPRTVIETLATLTAGVDYGSRRLTTSPGVLIDLEGVAERTIAFDLDSGWETEIWAQPVPATADLVPLLIER